MRYSKRTIKRGSGALLLAAALLGAVGCRPASRDAPLPDANILIIVVDALRADKLGCYGYERPTTPHIDALARHPDAVVFRRHYVQGAHTKASTASLFSGLFGFQHGVNWSQEVQPDPASPRRFTTQVVDERIDTMAERLTRVGFGAFAVVKSHHLHPEFGFAQGFRDYVSARDLRGDAERVGKTLQLVERARGPFFGYLHLAGVHHPFPAETRHPEIMGAFGFGYDEAARRAAGIDFNTAATKFAVNEGGLLLEPADVRFLHLVYDAELRSVDERHLGPLLEGLRDLGRDDATLVILTADHGEELYDHRGYAHGHALWDEVIHVPLIVKFPEGRKPESLGAEVHEVTQAIDLIPSLLSFFGHPVPSELPGTDIFRGSPTGSAYSEVKSGYMLVQGDHKLIEGAGGTFLSNLRSDPEETINLAAAQPGRVARMREAAVALRRRVIVRPAVASVSQTELDPEAIEALRSLGYLR